MITKYTILGERLSGTNLLEKTMKYNFKLKIIWKYGWKHFFGFSEYSDSDDTLFIGIIRDPYQWMNSLYRKPYHLFYFTNVDEFLNHQFCSYNNNLDRRHFKDNVNFITKELNSEIMEDRHLKTGQKYKNIFECRKTKLNFLLHEMPKKVKNYILIRYEDLCDHHDEILEKIRSSFDLSIKKKYIKSFVIPKKQKKYHIPKDMIYQHPDFDSQLEQLLKYNI